METGRQKFFKNKKIINLFVKIFRLLPDFILQFFWDCISRYSQIVFVALRYIILKSRIKSCGDNVKIGTNVQILAWDKLSIGHNVSIHSNCYIDANGTIEIGNNVSIAHNTSILSANHDWKDLSLPIKYNPVVLSKVIIHDDVWIGCGCRILADVCISNRSVIAAGAVVNKNVEKNTIVGGIPAKLIKQI
ncbi:acyltransferase [Bergeyella zoohelcum]|uniref:Galactoside O-acetyltransferase n=1 Tax=Bergeyella zoohelcum TaxID=1015 RepID=A0A7Z9CGK3_9FLAO|nr:acyltransferase [Bergeyella zoohelcum]VDH05093.1 Galactoside O-acetyltransferase [Bergeyella zoohelcum]